jgi:hypothetical protein
VPVLTQPPRRIRVVLLVVVLALGSVLMGTPTALTATADPAALIETVNPAQSVYQLHDNAGNGMDTLKVVVDPTVAGRYLGVYHWPAGGTFHVGVATSTNLRSWNFVRELDGGASQPYLAFGPPPEYRPILAEEAFDGPHLRFKYWASVAGMLGAAAPSETFDARRSLSTCAEGTPDIRSVAYTTSKSTMTSGSTIIVGHHYYAGCETDRQALGVLRNFSSWSTRAQPQIDDSLTTAGAVGKHGDRDTFRYGSTSWQVIEGAITTASAMGDWRNLLYDGSTARLLHIRTAGGSMSFANPSTTVAVDPSGVRSLIVTEYLPSSGATPGEAGELLYWNPLTGG